MSSLPRIELFDELNPGQVLVCLEINAAQRMGGTRSSGGSVLMIPVEKVTGSYQGKLLIAEGTLRLPGDSDGITVPAQVFGMNDFMLRVPLLDEQIQRIEDRRPGGNVLFELLLRGIGLVGGTTVVLRPNMPTSFVVPVDEWIKVLSSLGFGTRRLVELPPLPARAGASWNVAAQQIQAAAWRLAKHDGGAAMTEARVALERTLESAGEAISRPRKPNEPYRPFAEALKKELEGKHTPKSDDPYQVLADLVQVAISTFGYSSNPAHNALDSGERAHAELSITVATAIYVHFARTIR